MGMCPSHEQGRHGECLPVFGDWIITVIWLIVLLPLYFFPWIVAISRDHHNRTAIAVLNLLLGWTFIGWVAALVWACTATPRAK